MGVMLFYLCKKASPNKCPICYIRGKINTQNVMKGSSRNAQSVILNYPFCYERGVCKYPKCYDKYPECYISACKVFYLSHLLTAKQLNVI